MHALVVKNIKNNYIYLLLLIFLKYDIAYYYNIIAEISTISLLLITQCLTLTIIIAHRDEVSML